MLTRMGNATRRLISVGLWLALVISAAKVTHDFYRYVDHSIYVAVDDSEANIAYDLATHGRYGFPASPVLADMSRLDGQFNYGPWYFYLAGGLVWLFGFSLTLVRSIHLWVLLATIGAAGAWFNGRDRATVGVLYGLVVLYAFEASQWPMARPDILVSGFALAFIVCAGLGALRSRSVYWFCAGLAAACGAFTHLIAASLIPSAVLVLAWVSGWDLRASTDPASTRRHVWRASLALILGITLGVGMFYASFGFDFGTQWRFLSAYRSLTTKQSDTFLIAIGHHLNYAFVYLSPAMRYVVGAVFAAGWVMALAAERMHAPERRVVRASMLPPLVTWTGYILSGGFYTSYFSGYGVLHQVLFAWTGATLLWLTLWLAREWKPRVGAVVSVVALALVMTQAGRQLTWQLSADSWRVRRIDTWVSFSEYAAKVIEPLPDGATAWGSVIFGLQAPDRIQMINWVDAMALLSRVHESRREALSPDYVVLGYPELRDNMLMTTRSTEGLLTKTQEFIPGHKLRLVSLVGATPYGVSRTYARHAGNIDPDRLPNVSVYVPERQQWLHRIGPPSAVVFKQVAPVVLRVGYEAEPPESRPSMTVAGELPPGPYLLRVSVVPGAGDTERRMITATSSSMLVQTMSELGPEGDFAPYLAGDSQVFLLADHNGGPLSVSQFDDGAAPRIADVTAYPVVGLLERDELPSSAVALPALEKWEPTTGVQAKVDGNELQVTGDGTGSGYQLMSPLMRAREAHQIAIRISMRTISGRICTGILNGNGGAWLVNPDRARGELKFTVDETQAFRLVYANCNPREGSPPSRFAVAPGEILDEPPAASYAKRLVAAALHPELEQLDERAGPDVLTVPAGLVVSAATVSGQIEPVTSAELIYRAANASYDAGVWSFQGQAEGAYTYLVQTKERRLNADSRVLVQGRVAKGGIAIGLLSDNKWVSQMNITEPGEFTVVIAPPRRGSYSILVANVLPQGLETSIVLNKFGLVAKPGPASR